MKPKNIVYKLGEDEIAWTSPNSESLDFVLKNIVPKGAHYLCADNPEDYANYNEKFFSAFEFDWSLPKGEKATNIILNKEKAIEIFLKYIRNKRKELFEELDIEFMKALEQNNTTNIESITLKKQQLRNCTNINFSDVIEVSDLINKWPTNLLGENPF